MSPDSNEEEGNEHFNLMIRRTRREYLKMYNKLNKAKNETQNAVKTLKTKVNKCKKIMSTRKVLKANPSMSKPLDISE